MRALLKLPFIMNRYYSLTISPEYCIVATFYDFMILFDIL